MKNLLTLSAASIVALALLGAPAYADDHGRDHDGGWHGRYVREDHDGWRWHRHYEPVVYRGYYSPAPVVYYPQPVAYYQPPIVTGFSLFIR